MKRILELKQKRGKALADARAINDKAAGESRSPTDEEKEQYNRFMAEFSSLGEDIEREEVLAREEASMNELADEQVDQNSESRASGPGHGQLTDGQKRAEAQTRAWNSWCAGNAGQAELRALQVDQDVTGGYLQTPQQVVERILKAVDNRVFLRQLATVFRVPNAESLGVPSLDADPADPTRTTELLVGNEDSSMAFGKRKLTPTPFAVNLRVSKTMLRKIPNAGSLVEGRMNYKMAVVDEDVFQNGEGGDEPLGVFTAHTNGIPTSRDYSTDMLATSPTFDGLMGMKYALNDAYWAMPSTRWLFHPDTMLTIAKLKDGEGRYMLRESVRSGEPDILLGIPVALSRYTPNTLTSGLYFGMLGDFSYYWIADSLDMRIERDESVYRLTDQVGFFARAENDGMPVLAEAFVRGKLG